MPVSDNLKYLQNLYLSALNEYETSIDDDGDVNFIHPFIGALYIDFNADSDPEYLRIVLPAFIGTDDRGITKSDLIEIANEINNRKKAVKVYVTYSEARDAWFASAAIEAFVAGTDALPALDFIKATIGRNISVIRSGVEAFQDEIEIRLSNSGSVNAVKNDFHGNNSRLERGDDQDKEDNDEEEDAIHSFYAPSDSVLDLSNPLARQMIKKAFRRGYVTPTLLFQDLDGVLPPEPTDKQLHDTLYILERLGIEIQEGDD